MPDFLPEVPARRHPARISFGLYLPAPHRSHFGIIAGKMAAIAGAGYAKNLRHDIFYKVQEFSFKNIDRFSTSGLVTPFHLKLSKASGCAGL